MSNFASSFFRRRGLHQLYVNDDRNLTFKEKDAVMQLILPRTLRPTSIKQVIRGSGIHKKAVAKRQQESKNENKANKAAGRTCLDDFFYFNLLYLLYFTLRLSFT